MRDHGATVLPDEATLVRAGARWPSCPPVPGWTAPLTLAVVIASWAPLTNAILRGAPDLQSTAMALTAQQ